MPTTQQLREQRANVWNTMTEVMARPRLENGAMRPEDAEVYDRAEADFDVLEAAIQRQERHEAREVQNSTVDRRGVVPGAVVDTAEEPEGDALYERVFFDFMRHGMSGLNSEDTKLLQASFRQDAAIRNAAGVGTGAAGGYAVPPAYRNQFIERTLDFGAMLQAAEIIRTDTGANLPWVTADDTANVGAILGENTQVTEQDVTLGTASINAYMYTSKLVRESYQLINDRRDFETWLISKLAQRIGRIWNQHFTTGTGTSQPQGIVTGATVGVTGTGSLATTGGVSYVNLVDLIESLDPSYQGGDGLQFMGHQTVRRAFRRLTDTANRPLWEPSLQAGQPDSILGYGFRVNNDMPTIAQNSKSLIFGNFREAYLIRIVNDVATLRLTERYADFLQVGFLAFARADGVVQNANAVRVFQTTATA